MSGTPVQGSAVPRKRIRLRKLSRIAVTVVLLLFVLKSIDLRETWDTLASVAMGPLGWALAVLLIDRLVMVGKWLPLARVHVPLLERWYATKLYFASSFAGVLLPASVGGDVIRVLALSATGPSAASVGATVLVERLLGFLGVGLLSLISLAVAIHADVSLQFLIPWSLSAVAIPLAVISLPYLSRRWEWSTGVRMPTWMNGLERFGSAFSAYRSHTPILLLVAALSFLEQLLPLVANWFLARALSLDLTLSMLMVAVPLTVFVTRLPITVLGLGAAEGAFVYLLGLFGVEPSGALALALLGRAAGVLVMLPGAFFLGELARGAGAPETRPVEAGDPRV